MTTSGGGPDGDGGLAAARDRLRRELAGTRYDRVDWIAETGSTNADLLALARHDEVASAVLLAEVQSAGRGRMGRTWQAPQGSSLLLSVLVRPALPPAAAHLVTAALGLAALEAVAHPAVGLKWPNDLVVEDPDAGAGGASVRKLGGVLAESIVTGERLDAVVVGIGLNVNWPEELPDDLAAIATSLHRLTGAPVDRVGLAARILTGFDRRLDDLAHDDGRSRIVADYAQRCVTVGRTVRVELAHSELRGRVEAVTPDGGLVLVDGDGARHEVTVGDVTHLRPVDDRGTGVVPGDQAPGGPTSGDR